MSHKRASGVAWTLGVSAVALSAVTAVLAFAASETDNLEPLLFFASYAVIGSLIASRRPRNLVGWLMLGGGFSFTLMSFSGYYALYGLAVQPGALPAARAMAWPQTWLWIPGALLVYVLVPLYFPAGRLLSPRWSWLVRFIATAAGALAVVAATAPGDAFIQVRSDEQRIVNPFGIASLSSILPGSVLEALDRAIPFLLFGLLCLATLSLVIRFRRSDGVERQQLKWITYAITAFPVLLVLDLLNSPLGFIAGAIYFAGIPVAIGIAILKHNLYDIDIIINRTLVYGALTACVIGLYVLVVGGLGTLLHGRGGPWAGSGRSLFVSLLATGLVAVLFHPLRERLQRGVNRLVYGERDEPYLVLSRLGQRVEGTLTPDAVLPAIVETLAQALKLPYAAIALREEDGFVIAAASGVPVAGSPTLPLIYGNETVGELILAPRTGSGGFSPADQRLLADLARQIGVAAHAVQLTSALQQSRERLVTAREEERRRLRRDLHDGLGPSLASMTLQAEAARDLIVADPAEANELLADLTQQLQFATGDIRRLVYDLRPPALDDLGLVGAVRVHIVRYERGGTHFIIEAPEPLPALPAATEVAAYRIIQEAVTNVVRHAQASLCVIRLTLNEQLLVEIEDDGVGIPHDYTAGVGLSSMRERATELGGAWTVRPRPGGGALVCAVLPRD